MQQFETLKQLVIDAVNDVDKAEKGNKAAGTRLRKHMQGIKAAAQDVRHAVLVLKETPAAPAPTPPNPDQVGTQQASS